MDPVRQLITRASLRGPDNPFDIDDEQAAQLRQWVREHDPRNPHTAYIERFFPTHFTHALAETTHPDQFPDTHPAWHTWDGTLHPLHGHTPAHYPARTPQPPTPEPTAAQTGMSYGRALENFAAVRQEQTRQRRVALLKLLAGILALALLYLLASLLDLI